MLPDSRLERTAGGVFPANWRPRPPSAAWPVPWTAKGWTMVTVELIPSGSGTQLRLTHAGFVDQELGDRAGAGRAGAAGEEESAQIWSGRWRAERWRRARRRDRRMRHRPDRSRRSS